MLRWIMSDSPGEEIGRDLAEYAWEHSSLEDVRALQQLGVDTIIELYRRSPVWVMLSTTETKFRRLVDSFVNWQPPMEEDSAQPPEDASIADPIDLS